MFICDIGSVLLIRTADVLEPFRKPLVVPTDPPSYGLQRAQLVELNRSVSFNSHLESPVSPSHTAVVAIALAQQADTFALKSSGT